MFKRFLKSFQSAPAPDAAPRAHEAPAAPPSAGAAAWYEQARSLRQMDRLDEAAAAAARAAELAPENVDYAALHMQLLYAQGFAAEALEPLRRAIRLAPQRVDLRSRELFLLNLAGGESAQRLYERHARLGRELEAVVPPRQHAPRSAGKARLRIGLVSEDFCFHPVALFLLPWLEGRTRERFEVVCYSDTPGDNEMMRRIRALADRWVDATGMHDLQLADAIAADGVDVLLDLGGHTGRVRLGTFAARPAPVQGSWMGYLNTTGLTRIDFRITDARCDPPALSQPLHTERLLPMPHSQWCYRPFLRIAHAEAAPCERQGFVTFGSFNNVTKLTEGMAARWGRILRAVPTSRLLVAGVASGRKREALLAAIAAQGVDRARVEFAPRVDLEAYYRLMDRVDIALDSYPYGGGTTTFDALWMGLPVLTATGDLPASRSAASVLALLGLDEWVAPDIDGYEALAVARAADTRAIGQLRRSLRTRLQASPLMDEPGFVAAFERVLEQAWEAGCGAAGAAAVPGQESAHAERLVQQGNALEDAGRLQEALALYREAVRVAPRLARAHLNLGIGLAAAGDLRGAAGAHRDGLALEPEHPFLHYNLANVLSLSGDLAGAREHVQRALAAKPDLFQAHVLRAHVLEELGEDAQALGAIERALALVPASAGAHLNRVRLLQNLLRIDEAAAAARQGLQACPDDADLHWSLAITHLLRGDFAQGWKEHEWRPGARAAALPASQGTRWDGASDLQGRSILLHAEYGLGDTLQFLRFAPMIAARAGRVVLALQRPLAQLARGAMPPDCVVVAEGDPLPPTELHYPLLSLPFALGIGEAQLAAGVPYLRADPGRVAGWRARLGRDGKRFSVGLAWSGNPQHGNDRHRSMPLATLARLGTAAAECEFVSLQPQVREGDREALEAWPQLRPWGFELRDFADTAALVQALDLVVTVDTSVAHLAAAMGRPVWVLVPHVPDWRWMLRREDSPWYPSARIWRQSAPRDWAELVGRVGDALRQRAAAAAASP